MCPLHLGMWLERGVQQIENPGFWRMLFARQGSLGPFQAPLQQHPQTILSWPRGTVLPGDASSSSILYLLSWGAKKGGKDWCKIAQTVCLEDIVQGGVTKYFHCGGTGVCQPGMVQSSTKGSAPWLLPHGHSSEDWAWRAYTEELDLSYTGFKLMNEDMVIGLDIKTLSGWAGCALIARKLLHFWRSTAALYKSKGNLQTSAQRYS